MGAPAVLLTPLDPTRTVRRPTFRRPTSDPGGPTRMEIVSAVSADGDWTYLRDDERRGSWHVRHNPTGQTVWDVASSLRGARAATGSGWVTRTLRGAA